MNYRDKTTTKLVTVSIAKANTDVLIRSNFNHMTLDHEMEAVTTDRKQRAQGKQGDRLLLIDGVLTFISDDAFDSRYETVDDTFDFGIAIAHLKEGKGVMRKGWNGKNMYITLIKAGNAKHQGYDMQDCLGMKTATNEMQPGWLASQADMLANDWQLKQ